FIYFSDIHTEAHTILSIYFSDIHTEAHTILSIPHSFFLYLYLLYISLSICLP
ncbi:unnamed protein product, partial [Candidula unifasciata]